MEEYDLRDTEIDHKKLVQREMLFETEVDQFPNVLLGSPTYSYDRSEIFVEFDTSGDDDYLGRAYIRWSVLQWLGKKENPFWNWCDMCGKQDSECMECNACEFDLDPFKFKGPCRFQERERRTVCMDCFEEMERLVEKAMKENPSSFVAREI